jgi:hypothetical protein
MNPPEVVGVVGTAKNTGKTTALAHLIERAHMNNLRTAITGIGYDGEDIDNITMLPKPRLFLNTGTILTSAELCVERSSIEYKILRRTGIPSALGELLIVEVTKPGLLVVAGPNKVASLQTVIGHLRDMKAEIVFVDGSINRMMPMSIVDRIIFATGASRNVDITFLSEEMRAIEYLFRSDVDTDNIDKREGVLIDSGSDTVALSICSVIDEEDVDIIRKHVAPGGNRITVPGLISKSALQFIGNKWTGISDHIQIMLSSPFPLLISENRIEVAAIIESLRTKGITISYQRKPKFIGVTINPFYPRYEQERFSTAYIDKDTLITEVRSKLSVPVFNVLDDIDDRLFTLCVS